MRVFVDMYVPIFILVGSIYGNFIKQYLVKIIWFNSQLVFCTGTVQKMSMCLLCAVTYELHIYMSTQNVTKDVRYIPNAIAMETIQL